MSILQLCKSSLFILFFLLLTACGYHIGQGGVVSSYSTISIPYVDCNMCEGVHEACDIDGNLTAAIIRRIDTSGVLRYTPCSGDLILNSKIIEIRDENIGFRYDRDKDGKETHTIIPTETRRRMIVEISVQELCSCRVVLGPVRLTASCDFDHDYFSSPDGINVFSLGQLTDIEAAEDAVIKPLNEKMAQKIVDYICGSW